MIWRARGEVAWLEADLAGQAVATFSTRDGGVSRGDFSSLNLGVVTDDRTGDVLENRRRLAEALGIEAGRVSMGFQVHGNVVREADSREPGPFQDPEASPPIEADGQFTDETGRPLLVLVADCLPVALLGERGLAMLHCGWRGLAAGIVEAAVGRIGAVAAAIGPGIGPCCFEVGSEVAAEFEGLGQGLMQGRNLDLPEAARRILTRRGAAEGELSGTCTACDPRFFSHRRDSGRTGRQAGIAWLK